MLWAGTLTNFTVLPSIALVTTTAIHSAVGVAGTPMKAGVVLTGICGVCGMTGSVRMDWTPWHLS